MKVYLKSDVECTVDGVGLLEPGKLVEVDVVTFELYHKVMPTKANFPKTVTVIYDTDRDSSAVESSDDNNQPPATNIGSGNDEETHQDEKEEA